MYAISGLIICSAIMTASIFIVCMNISFYLLFFFIAYIYVLLKVQGIYIVIKKDIHRCLNISKTPIVNLIGELIEGRQIFKVFNKQEQAVEELKDFIDENTKNAITSKSVENWFNSTLYLLNFLLPSLFSYGLAIFLLSGNYIKGKEAVLAIIYLVDVINEMKWFVQTISKIETQVVSLERCDAFNNIPKEKGYFNIKKHEKYLTEKISRPIDKFLPLKVFSTNLRRNEKLPYEKINAFYFNKYIFNKGEIEFQNVYAKYPIGKDYVLKNISFKLKSGEKLGICGKTGSGKSTIIKVINHYLDIKKGSILIDGYDITQLDSKKLRSELLIISQEIALYEGTIRENLNPKYMKLRKNSKKKKKKRRTEQNDL